MNQQYKRLFTLIFFVMVAFTLFSCATAIPFKQVQAPPQGKAMVYVYRTFNVLGGGATPSVYLNGKEVYTGLANRMFFNIEVSPGTNNFQAKQFMSGDGEVFVLNAMPQKIHYLRLDPFNFDFTAVPESEALAELKDCYEAKK